LLATQTVCHQQTRRCYAGTDRRAATPMPLERVRLNSAWNGRTETAQLTRAARSLLVCGLTRTATRTLVLSLSNMAAFPSAPVQRVCPGLPGHPGPARVPARNSRLRRENLNPCLRVPTVDLSLTEVGQLLRSLQRQAGRTSRLLTDRPYACPHTHTHPPPPAAYSSVRRL
jgi:hypothetical protein